jgi:hypothetical protein
LIFTPEMRAKGAATRAANKLKREEKARRKEERDAANHSPNNGSEKESSQVDQSVRAELPSNPVSMVPGNVFDWENCPLVDAINKQADMKREYERISQIVLRRQNPPGRRWTCWTDSHKDLIRANMTAPNSRAVIQACLKSGEDGKQSFRDDGRFIIENGVKRLQPAFCCNAFCFRAYQQLHKLENQPLT